MMHARKPSDHAVSELVGIILISFLVLLVVIIATAFFLGYFSQVLGTQPFLALDSEHLASGQGGFITLYHRGGDNLELSRVGNGTAYLQLSPPDGKTVVVTPDPPKWFVPGDTLYLGRSSSGTGYALYAEKPAAGLALGQGQYSVSLVSNPNNILIYKGQVTVGAAVTSTPGPTSSVPQTTSIPTTTPTATGTPVLTPSVSPTTTTTSPSPTQEPTVTPTVFPTGTATPSPTGTPVVTPSVSPTPSPTPVYVPGFTTMAWVRWNTDPYASWDKPDRLNAAVYGDGDGDWSQRWSLGHDSQNTRFIFNARTVNCDGYRPAWSVVSGTSPEQGQSYFLAGTYNGDTGMMTIYVNGQQENTITGDASGLVPSMGMLFTGRPNGIPWNGKNNQRRFFGSVWKQQTLERCLSGQEIMTGYLEGPG
jgi:hypothetical protein